MINKTIYHNSLTANKKKHKTLLELSKILYIYKKKAMKAANFNTPLNKHQRDSAFDVLTIEPNSKTLSMDLHNKADQFYSLVDTDIYNMIPIVACSCAGGTTGCS